MESVYIVGVVGIVVFYLIILGLGLWAARRRKEGEEEAMLAGRSIGKIVGTFTMTGIKLSQLFDRVKSSQTKCVFRNFNFSLLIHQSQSV